MSADTSPEFSGWTGEGQSGADPSGPVTDADRPDDVRPADAEVEESTSADESRDPDHGYDSMAESGTENAAEDEVSDSEDEEGLLPPGSTAEGSGTSLGAVPAEAAREAEPLGEHDGEGTPGQLADERWRTNGVNPLG
ncbi:hypothetical protein C1I63_07820 [Rathayibacter caricis DSM 15933]|jgi:hypothetical protein|uniref:Uncharacterized protein n=1 Tax=Rathayibacter caricis DSM 15933 TaxID=1328867 RepID=A0A2T4UTC7_9MICO|nr:hypothetical protein [Rathayibacter caricis]MCJ1695681.1 hypothetical protein [Rathayibacter caricis]PTL72763.1 hypothetical protein C1I63_07820 [Rathayibacter caricis DSM 15933]